jgi:DsbC/DsbD-like thiol-disulfide interchange protein
MNLPLSGVVLAAAIAASQSSVPPSAKPGTVDTPHLTVTTSTGAASVAPGSRVSLFVEVAPKPKMHVYAPEQKAYLPVSLRLEPSPGVTARLPIFPKGESIFFAPTSETQIVYSQPFRIELPVTTARGRPAGPVTIIGTLEYQACDDRVCYIPRKVQVTWKLNLQ